MRALARLTVGVGALALAACSTANEDARPRSAAAASSDAPYASTYTRYPGRPTALVGATVYDGKGGRIDNGTVLFRDGEIVGIGDAAFRPTAMTGSTVLANSSPPG